MVDLISSDSFWILDIVHSMVILEFLFYRLCKRYHSIRINDEFSTTENKNASASVSFDENVIPYMRFPKNSLSVFIISLKVSII